MHLACQVSTDYRHERFVGAMSAMNSVAAVWLSTVERRYEYDRRECCVVVRTGGCALFSSLKKQKVFKIPRYIESYGTCMKH